MTYELGTTVRLKVTVKDFSGSVTDPDSAPTVSVWDGGKVKRVDGQTSVKDSAGVYHYDATLDESWSVGTWLYEWRTSMASKSLVARGVFNVAKTSQ